MVDVLVYAAAAAVALGSVVGHICKRLTQRDLIRKARVSDIATISSHIHGQTEPPPPQLDSGQGGLDSSPPANPDGPSAPS